MPFYGSAVLLYPAVTVKALEETQISITSFIHNYNHNRIPDSRSVAPLFPSGSSGVVLKINLGEPGVDPTLPILNQL